MFIIWNLLSTKKDATAFPNRKVFHLLKEFVKMAVTCHCMLEKKSSGDRTKTISERKVFERITVIMVLRIALYFLFMSIY